MGNAILREYDVSEVQRASAGLGLRWKVYPATNKKTKVPVCIFILEKKSLPKEIRNEQFYELIRKGVSNLAKLRHPHLLNVLNPLDEDRTSFVMITEPIEYCLANVMGYTANLKDNAPKVEFTELDIKNGVRQVCEAVLFCHRDAKLYHFFVHPNSIYITERGDWKLAGFNFATSVQAKADVVDLNWEFGEASHLAALPGLETLAPEIPNKKQASHLADCFSVGLLVYQLHRFYLKVRPDKPFEDLYAYNGFIHNLHPLAAKIKNFPASLQSPLSRLLYIDADKRMDIIDFLKSKFFSDILVRTLRYVDALLEKDLPNRIKFLKQLPKALKMFDQRTACQKILPPLLVQLQDRDVALFALPAVMAICKDTDRPYFSKTVMPPLVPLLAAKDPPQMTFCLLKSLPLLMDKANAGQQRDHILPMISRSLESNIPALQTQILKEITNVALQKQNSFSFRDLKTLLLPRIAKLCQVKQGPNTLSIRVNAMICLSKIFHLFDTETINNSVLDAVDQAVDTDDSPAVLMSALGVYEAVAKHVGVQLTAKRILPKLIPMSLSPQLNLNQCQTFFRITKNCFERLEKARIAELQKADYLTKQSQAHQKQILGDDDDNPFEMTDNKAMDEILKEEYEMADADDNKETGLPTLERSDLPNLETGFEAPKSSNSNGISPNEPLDLQAFEDGFFDDQSNSYDVLTPSNPDASGGKKQKKYQLLDVETNDSSSGLGGFAPVIEDTDDPFAGLSDNSEDDSEPNEPAEPTTQQRSRWSKSEKTKSPTVRAQELAQQKREQKQMRTQQQKQRVLQKKREQEQEQGKREQEKREKREREKREQEKLAREKAAAQKRAGEKAAAEQKATRERMARQKQRTAQRRSSQTKGRSPNPGTSYTPPQTSHQQPGAYQPPLQHAPAQTAASFQPPQSGPAPTFLGMSQPHQAALDPYGFGHQKPQPSKPPQVVRPTSDPYGFFPSNKNTGTPTGTGGDIMDLLPGPPRPTQLSGPPLSGPPLSGSPHGGHPLPGPPLSGSPHGGPPLSGSPHGGHPLSRPPHGFQQQPMGFPPPQQQRQQQPFGFGAPQQPQHAGYQQQPQHSGYQQQPVFPQNPVPGGFPPPPTRQPQQRQTNQKNSNDPFDFLS